MSSRHLNNDGYCWSSKSSKFCTCHYLSGTFPPHTSSHLSNIKSHNDLFLDKFGNVCPFRRYPHSILTIAKRCCSFSESVRQQSWRAH
jgi:hypothetical protein